MFKLPIIMFLFEKLEGDFDSFFFVFFVLFVITTFGAVIKADVNTCI